MLTDFRWHFGITVARQIHQKPVVTQLEKIQMLGSSRRFTDESETITACQGVDRAGLARIRAPGKGYLDSNRRRQVA